MDELERGLADLKTRFAQLGRQLAEQGSKLADAGCPPESALIKELSEARRSFQSLAESLKKAAADLAEQEPVGEPRSLIDLEAIWRKLANKPTATAGGPHLEPAVGPEVEERDTAFFSTARSPAGTGAPVNGESAKRRLSRLIYVLLREKRLEPAYWLVCYHEQLYGIFPVPPVLIKAVELAEMIEGSGGPAERWLKHAYGHPHFREACRARPEGPEGLANSLMAVAALLRPALVAPDSGAPTLLAALDGLPRGLALVAGLVTGRGKADDPRAPELKALSDRARSWRQRNSKLSMAAPLAARLWEEMQKEGGLVYRLLHPLIGDGTVLDHQEVRCLVDMLRDEEALKSEVATSYRRMQAMEAQPDIFHILGSWQILARLREALDLAQRWLDLQEIVENTALNGVDERMFQQCLREAGDELEAIRRQYPDHLLLTAAVSLCGNALLSLEHSVRRMREAPVAPEALAAREIRKHPQLKLEPFLMPAEEAVERLGRALVELLEDLPPHDQGAVDEKGLAEMFAGDSELDRLWDRGALTPQEKRFIRDTFFDRLGREHPNPGGVQKE